MAKIDVRVILKGIEDNLDLTLKAIKTKNKINYNENNIKVTIIFTYNEIHMKRVCNEYEINLKFKEKEKTISNYKLFGVNKTFDLETYTSKLLINDDKIVVDYNLEGNDFSFVLEECHEKSIKGRN